MMRKYFTLASENTLHKQTNRMQQQMKLKMVALSDYHIHELCYLHDTTRHLKNITVHVVLFS